MRFQRRFPVIGACVLDYKDLMAGVDCAIDQGIADPQRLGVCGLSYGGYMTCFIVGQTGRFKAAVAENPITDLVSRYGTADMGPWGSLGELGGKPHEIPDVTAAVHPSLMHTNAPPNTADPGRSGLPLSGRPVRAVLHHPKSQRLYRRDAAPAGYAARRLDQRAAHCPQSTEHGTAGWMPNIEVRIEKRIEKRELMLKTGDW